MDQDENLTEIEKNKLAIFLQLLKVWWNDRSNSRESTLELVNAFEDFRKELDKKP